MNDARVWLIDMSSPEATALAANVSVLSDVEVERGERFLLARDRDTFIAAHVLLRFALSRIEHRVDPSTWAFRASANGRPELDSPLSSTGLRFNISHTTDLVACVITHRVDCGVDVERHTERANVLQLAKRCLTPTEYFDLSLIAPEQRSSAFVRYWTLKEAFAKATGDGMRLDFRAIETDLHRVGPPGTSTCLTDGETRSWQRWQWNHNGMHEAAVCVRLPASSPPVSPRLVLESASVT